MTNGASAPGDGTGRSIVVHPVFRVEADGELRTPAARLEEAVGLANAIDLNVMHAECIRVNRPQPSTLFGGGAVETLTEIVTERDIEIVIVDHALSPVQQRNLERALKAKVIDRTGLILEIFGKRARTREGQLQVELASLTYQRSRLVRSWTHLERQRGGFGFLGGPGESQIEMDRRLISERIIKIKKELEEVRRTRGLHRKARAKVPYPVVALVGYTNAGKSTLFNRLAGADVFAKDLLFATLDPTMRQVELPSGRKVILSDTVGFISDLPHGLVAAFRATLEEVDSADIILHVRDIAHGDSAAQAEDVAEVLREIGMDPDVDERLVEVLNKVDLLEPEDRAAVEAQCQRDPRKVALSAGTGEGIADLDSLLDRLMNTSRKVVDIAIGVENGAAMAWLYDKGEILERSDDEKMSHLRVALDPSDLARFEKRFLLIEERKIG
jgi:GTPase